MYKKIALIFIILALIIAGVAVYLFNQKQANNLAGKSNFLSGLLDNSQTDDSQPASSADQNSETGDQANKPAPNRPPRSREDLEKVINQQITAKDVKIVKEAQGRNYTKDELSFIDNPRQNIIDNMIANGELTEEEIKILQ